MNAMKLSLMLFILFNLYFPFCMQTLEYKDNSSLNEENKNSEIISLDSSDDHKWTPINPKPSFTDKMASCNINVIRFGFYNENKSYVNIPIFLKRGIAEISKEDKKIYFYWNYDGDDKIFLSNNNANKLVNLLNNHKLNKQMFRYAVGKYQATIFYHLENALYLSLYARHKIIGDSYVFKFDLPEENGNSYNSFEIKLILATDCGQQSLDAFRNITAEHFNIVLKDYYQR